MKTKTITALLLLSATLLTAQTEKSKDVRETKVRIKKIETVNGVEKITDTTYVINGPADLNALNELEGNKPSVPEIIILKEGDKVIVDTDGTPPAPGAAVNNKIIIVKDETHGDSYAEVRIGGELDGEMERALKAARANTENLKAYKVVTINSTNTEGEKKELKNVVIIKTIKLSEASEQDQKMLGKQTGVSDQKLKLDQMNFYPNPNTGKFNLAFNLQDNGDTEINILNMEGKAVYHEKLNNFTGHYDQEIDISSQPRGVYFVKVVQGAHAYVKKMMIE